MRSISFIVIFSILSFQGTLFAELGQTINKFRRSALVRNFKFALDSILDTGPYSTTPNKEKHFYKSGDSRYKIEIVIDKEGKNIDQQKLSYAYDKTEAPGDKRCALEFVTEATARKIDENNFLRLFSDAKDKHGTENKLIVDGFVITVAVYQHALYKEWNITVRKIHEKET